MRQQCGSCMAQQCLWLQYLANSVPPTRWFLSKRFTVAAACWLRFFQGLVACRAVLHRTVKLKLCCMRVLFASARHRYPPGGAKRYRAGDGLPPGSIDRATAAAAAAVVGTSSCSGHEGASHKQQGAAAASSLDGSE